MINLKVIFTILTGYMILFTSVEASPTSGQKIYLKKLRVACGFSGVKFAHNHSQDEWESIKESGNLPREIKKICPKSNLDKKYVSDIYDFLYIYANDSGNVPSI